MDLEQYRRAIRQIESGGDYGAIGPVTAKGNRAYGADQVMDFNIGPWTKKWYGEELTPEQYLRNEAAQDAVFNGQFGSYLERYGNPEDAASMWFTGKPLAQGADRRDVLGTTGSGYVQKFNRALKGGDMEQPFISTQGGQEEEQPGFFQNPNVWDALALGFNSMRLNPDAGLSRAVQARMQARQEQAKSKQTINKTVEMLTRIGADPKLIEAARAGYAKEALAAAIATPKDTRTAAQRDYLMAKEGGYEGSFFDYQQDLKRAGANVTNVSTTEKASERMAKLMVDEAFEVRKAGATASRSMAELTRLEGLLQNAPQGGVGAIKSLAGQFGIDSEGLNEIQAAEAIINRLVPQQRQPGSGPMSDADLALFKRSLPQILNQPGGNKLILDTLKAIAEYDMQRSLIADKFLGTDLSQQSFNAYMEQMNSLSNPLSAFKTAGQGSSMGRDDALNIILNATGQGKH